MATYKVTAESNTTKIEVKKVEYSISLARTGGQGAANTSFGGLEVSVTNPEEGDLLTVSDSRLINVRRATITDGGNF
jgi:hypothetical protein